MQNKKLEILAHRGYWKSEKEKNTLYAFEKAFENTFGIETDLRDFNGEIIISHDIPLGNEVEFEEVLKILDKRNLPLALNIKSDGLAEKIGELLKKYQVENYFTFDMSIPQTVIYKDFGIKFFTGISDICQEGILLQDAQGVWLDSFYADWFDKKEIYKYLEMNKKVCIVSPDLHKREYKTVWNKYKNIEGIMLCTDFPEEAKEFF